MKKKSEDLFEQSLTEIRGILERSEKFTRRSIFYVCAQIIVENDRIEDYGTILWKYIHYLHHAWIQASYRDRINPTYQWKVRRTSEGILLSGIAGNETLRTHLLNLNHAVWNTFFRELTEYDCKVAWIDTHYKKFNNRITAWDGKIREGKYYTAIKDYEQLGTLFTQGKVYRCHRDNCLLDDHGAEKASLGGLFRPATELEILASL